MLITVQTVVSGRRPPLSLEAVTAGVSRCSGRNLEAADLALAMMKASHFAGWLLSLRDSYRVKRPSDRFDRSMNMIGISKTAVESVTLAHLLRLPGGSCSMYGHTSVLDEADRRARTVIQARSRHKGVGSKVVRGSKSTSLVRVCWFTRSNIRNTVKDAVKLIIGLNIKNGTSMIDNC